LAYCRRKFLLSAPAALLAVPARSQGPPSIGLQLYTVRSLLERDYEGTLARVAGLGYRTVEFAGLYPPSSPRQTLAMLKRQGLSAPSGHASQEKLERDLPATLRTANELEHQFIVCPSVDASPLKVVGDWKRLGQRFNRIGEQVRRAGLSFAYHNHDFEFRRIEGQIPYDVLLAETDPALVKLEIDLYWMARANRDPVAYFQKYPARFPLVHLKDMAAHGAITEVGMGTIDFRRILAHASLAGLVHCFVEHDDPQDPLRSIETSLRYLRQLG
jgi:sugar phosphate isomerase/epimerase